MPRVAMQRKQIAEGTVQILNRGFYQSPNGYPIDIAADLHNCIENTHCYEPEALAIIRDEALAQPAEFNETAFKWRMKPPFRAAHGWPQAANAAG